MARRQRKIPMVRKTNYGQLHHALGPQSVLSEDNVAQIHENALRVLQELGISILLPEARELLKSAGAQVWDHMVHFPRDMAPSPRMSRSACLWDAARCSGRDGPPR